MKYPSKGNENWVWSVLQFLAEILLMPILFVGTLFFRFWPKKKDIGLGPEPLINNIYHKKALEKYGYTVETFATHAYFITEQFDVRGNELFEYLKWFPPLRKLCAYLFLFVFSMTRFKALYLYFNGGILGLASIILWRVEPFLYKLANIKIVMMPYGSDIQDMTRSPNLLFKNAVAQDYPEHKLHRKKIALKIELWTKYADHIIGGCEWVDYLYHWDTLTLGHFSIDTDLWKPSGKTEPLFSSGQRKLKILHAPNHRAIKGTRFFIKAVEKLIDDGFDVEFVILEKVTNDEVRKAMASADIVADQLIVGWYAMFAIEAMAMEKPVLCYLRDDIETLYVAAGLVLKGEIPIIKCSVATVTDVIKEIALDHHNLMEIGKRSRDFVVKHHSLDAMGKVFDEINQRVGIVSSGAKKV